MMRWPVFRTLLGLLLAALCLLVVGRVLFVPPPPSPPGGGPAPRHPPTETGARTAKATGKDAAVAQPEVPSREAGLEGRVLAPGGLPAARASVTLWKILSPRPAGLAAVDPARPVHWAQTLARRFASVEGRAVTRGDGRFSFRRLDPSLYLVAARSSAHAPGVTPGISLRPGALREVEVRLQAGHAIAGRVVDGGGKAVAGASVRALRSAPGRWRLGSLPFIPRDTGDLVRLVELFRTRSAATRTDGSFRLEGLAAATYNLQAFSTRYGRGEAAGVRAPEPSVLIVLLAGGAILGRVRTPDTVAVQGALVRAFLASELDGPLVSRRSCHPQPGDATLHGRAITDRQGRFALLDLPPDAGAFTLVVSRCGFQPLTVPRVRPRRGRPPRLELEIKPGHRIAGLVVGADGAPVPGVPVRMESPPPESDAGDGAGKDTLQVVTQRDGSFSADTLRPAPYTLSVAPFPPYGPCSREVLPNTQDVLLTLETEPVAVAGRVLEAQGEDPIAGARVTLPAIAGGTRAPRDVSAFTDEEGRFEIRASLPPGPSACVAEAPGHLTARVPVSLPGKVAAPARRIEIRLQEAGALEGVVKTTAGDPVGGAFLQLGPTPFLQGPAGRLSFARTEDDGTFRFSLADAAAGATYTVAVRHDDLVPAGAAQDAAPLSAAGLRPVLTVSVEDPSRIIRGLEILLVPGARLRGTVLSAARRATGVPVTLYRVATPHPAAGSPAMVLPLDEVSTDHRGRFEFRALPAGTYELQVRTAGRAPYRSGAIQLAPAARIEQEIVLEPGKAIRGQVVDEALHPVPSATVEARSPATGTLLRTVSDSTGRFEIRTATADTCRLVVSHSGFAREVLENVPPGTTDLEVVLYAYGSLEAEVSDLATGQPVESFEVRLLPDHVDLRVREEPGALSAGGKDGRFGPRRVAPGPYRLVVEAPGYLRHESALAIEPAEQESVAVQLDPGESIRGAVVGVDGAPLAGVAVQALRVVAGPNARKEAAGSGVTDAAGVFHIRALTAGRYELQAVLGGYVTTSAPAVDLPRAAEGGAASVRIVLERAGGENR